jgi:hypothetical protein
MVCADRMGAGLRLDTEAIAEGILEREAGPRAAQPFVWSIFFHFL